MPAWILAAIGCSMSYGLNNIFLKLSAGRVTDSLGSMMIHGISFSLLTAYFLFMTLGRGVVPSWTSTGLAASAGSGFANAFGILLLFATFRLGAPVSLAVPFLLVGQIVISTLAGTCLFNEAMSASKLMGLGLCTAGILLASK